jgi:hypothetical protein
VRGDLAGCLFDVEEGVVFQLILLQRDRLVLGDRVGVEDEVDEQSWSLPEWWRQSTTGSLVG